MTSGYRILALNPGSTSTKFAVYDAEHELLTRTLRHSNQELAAFMGKPILDQFDFRSRAIESELETAGFDLHGFQAIVGRGGLLKPLASGTYTVTALMLADLRQAERGEHASNLGAIMADALAKSCGPPTGKKPRAFIVDPVSVDEWEDVARLSGTPLIERPCLSHALNTKAVAKRFAREQKRPYEQLSLVVAHIGSGNTVSAHRGGRMIDAFNSREEGSMSPLRAGTVPAIKLVELCFESGKSAREIESLLCKEGGLNAYLGTTDLVEVERRIAAGDARAALVYDAMIYQIAKDIGAMATVLNGAVDAVLITGGMAYSALLLGKLRQRVEFIAPVHVYPGEDEVRALAEGALRVLRGEEKPRDYDAVGKKPPVVAGG